MKLSLSAGLALLAIGSAHAAPVGETFTYTGQLFDQFAGVEPNPFRGHSITMTIHFNTKLPHSKTFTVSTRKGTWSASDGITTVTNGSLSSVEGAMRVRDNSVVTYAQIDAISSFYNADFTVCDPVHCATRLTGAAIKYYSRDRTSTNSETAISTTSGVWSLVPNGGQPTAHDSRETSLSRGLRQ